ncbi:MAG: hypothetical protein HOQ22_16720, partial [Nocardioidaceae bacterium]|nr:hypothetical protein [Nocardioidaceae bacterium]
MRSRRPDLAALSGRLVDLLRATSCLERITPERCDALLGWTTTREALAELEEHGVLERADDGYRLPEDLRLRLEVDTLDSLPGPAVRQHYRRAATLLRAEGEYAEAVRVVARVADWASVRDILGHHGEAVLAERCDWASAVPDGVLV